MSRVNKYYPETNRKLNKLLENILLYRSCHYTNCDFPESFDVMELQPWEKVFLHLNRLQLPLLN